MKQLSLLRRALVFIGVILLGVVYPSIVHAEFCWMTGCEGALGYIPLQIDDAKSGITVFRGTQKPRIGDTATLNEYVYLRSQPLDVAQGPFVLSPGTVVKVLEYVTRKGEFAVVRVQSNANDRRQECMSAAQCRAKFY